MKIFVLGATGYIGNRVAEVFRRQGHEVWGLTRSAGKARQLAAREIHPVIGDLREPASYRDAAEGCSVLVHAAVDYEHGTAELDRHTVENLIELAGQGPGPVTFLYTSGCWVHGDTGGHLVDETTPLSPARAVTWRPAVEDLVLDAMEVEGVVLRPGCVYGGSGGLTGSWFAGASGEGPFEVVGDGTNRWAMVHVDDLAEAYLLAAAAPGGEIFDLADPSRWTVGEMARAAARAAGYEGEIRFVSVAEAAENLGPMAEALALDQRVDGRKAVRQLGWQPFHTGFVDEVETYYAAWRAASGD